MSVIFNVQLVQYLLCGFQLRMNYISTRTLHIKHLQYTSLTGFHNDYCSEQASIQVTRKVLHIYIVYKPYPV